MTPITTIWGSTCQVPLYQMRRRGLDILAALRVEEPARNDGGDGDDGDGDDDGGDKPRITASNPNMME